MAKHKSGNSNDTNTAKEAETKEETQTTETTSTTEAQGEQTTETPTTDQSTESQVAPAPTEPTQPATDTQQDQVSDAEPAEEAAPTTALGTALQRYVENMRPGRAQTEADGAREQQKLLNAMINNVFGSPTEEFRANMKTWLDTVKKHRDGVFHERYVFRFVASMNVPKERRELFEDLITLTLATSDSDPAQAKKLVEVNSIIDRLVDERMIENLQSYYNLG